MGLRVFENPEPYQLVVKIGNLSGLIFVSKAESLPENS
jgi:hypothetical protein